MHPVARFRPPDTPRVRARRYARRRAWPRVLALTIALLVPTAHATFHAAPSLTLTLSSETSAPEFDLIASAPRPQTRTTPRAIAPHRSTSVVPPRPAPAPPYGHFLRTAPPWPRPLHSLYALRSVVLRC